MSRVTAPVMISSIVKARWKATSWSRSACWMYLSLTPTSLRKTSVPNDVTRIAQMP